MVKTGDLYLLNSLPLEYLARQNGVIINDGMVIGVEDDSNSDGEDNNG